MVGLGEDPFGIAELVDEGGIPLQEVVAMSAEVQQSPISSILSYFAAMGGAFEGLQEFEDALLDGGADVGDGRSVSSWTDLMLLLTSGRLLLVPLGVRGFVPYESSGNVIDYAPRLTVAACAAGELACHEYTSLDYLEAASSAFESDGRRHVIRPKMKRVGDAGNFTVTYQVFVERGED
jgi:hypothetical protein